MSIIGTAIGGGIGDGMVAFGQQLARNDERRDLMEERARLRKEELDQKYAFEREKYRETLKARLEELEAKKAEALARVAVEAERRKSKAVDYADLVGVERNPTDRSQFVSEEVSYSKEIDPAAVGENSDAVSRRAARDKEATETRTVKFDQKGYDAAEQRRFANNRRIMVEVDKPDAYDDYERGRGRSIVNQALEKDPLSTDALAASMAVEAKDRFGQSGNGNVIVDRATGAYETTDVGASVVKKNERPPAARGGASEDGKTARADRAGAERLLRDAQKSLDALLKKEPPLSPKGRAEHEANIKSARDLVARREREYNEAGRRTAGGSGSAKDNATAAPAGSGGKKDYSRLW